jgi:calcineurin-like phosphoesterase family protein
MVIFVTADQHWGHTNILTSCNRQFTSISDHDAELIRVWNNAVGDKDIVYHLGDVTLKNAAFAREIFRQLNGSIHVLRYPWHHDSRWIKSPQWSKNGPVEIEEPIVVLERMLKSGDEWLPVVLCHYPFEIWDRKHYGAVHLHGHTHGGLKQVQNRMDVGVDMAFKLFGEYRPFRMEEALAIATSSDITQ